MRPPGFAQGALARTGFAAIGVASAVLLQTFPSHQPSAVPLLLAVGLLVLSALRPFDGLLVLAGLGPLVTMLLVPFGVDAAGGTRFTEVLTLAFICGAAARQVFDPRPSVVPARLAWPAAALAVAALASAAVQAAVLRAEQPALTLGGDFPVVLLRDFLLLPNPVARGVQIAEGLVLVLLVCAICGGDASRLWRTARMMVVAAAAAAGFNVLRVILAAIPREHFWTALGGIAAGVRVNVHFPDWNAAGSYFAMMLFVAAAFAMRRPRRYTVLVLVIGAALWLTGSRTALGAATIVAAALALMAMRGPSARRWPVVTAFVLLLVTAGAGWHFYPSQRNDAAGFSLFSRVALAKAGVRMAADYPVFGVGVQQYYERSDEYVGDVLRSFGRERENAHNYFIQILAELGVPGLLLFAAVIWMPLRAAWIAAANTPGAWGLAAGLTAYLLTCVGGHPLITPEASYPFWLALGVAAAAAAPAPPAGRLFRWTMAAAIAVLAGSIPLRAAEAVRHAYLENTTTGLSPAQRGPDDVRFRHSDGHSTFFIDATASAVVVRLRLGPDAPGPLTVRFVVNGRQADRVSIDSSQTWRLVRFVRPEGVRGDYARVDLDVDIAGVAGTSRSTGGAAPHLLDVSLPLLLFGSDAPEHDVPLLADVDGDGRADFIVWSAETGKWRYLPSTANYDDTAVASWDPIGRHAGGMPLAVDMDGDGRADPVVWRSSSATWQWLASSAGYRRASVETRQISGPTDGAVPLAGDVDGDGRADLVLWRPATHSWQWLTSASGYTQTGTLAMASPPGVAAVPLLGNLDGSRRAVLALWTATPAGGAALVWARPDTAALGHVSWPDRDPADIPRLFDMDRDGRADLLAWRPLSGVWTWLTSAAGFAGPPGTRPWGRGALGDVPLVADLDGDGVGDLVVWRPSTREWYWLTSSSGYDPAVARLKIWKF